MRIVIPGRAGGANSGAPLPCAGPLRHRSQPVSVCGSMAGGLWDGVAPGSWVSELESSDVCINLTGRSVNCRYTAENRREIYDSRVRSTRLLESDVIGSLSHPPRLWLNASTATIYRHALDRPMNEADGELGGNEPGAPDTWNFSIDVAKGWEKAFFAKPTSRTRQVALRSAITLSPDRGGIFDVLLGLVRVGLAGRRDQGSSLFHGFTRMILCAVEFLIAREEFSGVVNLASPNPLPESRFHAGFAQTWGTRVGLPAPAHG